MCNCNVSPFLPAMCTDPCKMRREIRVFVFDRRMGTYHQCIPQQGISLCGPAGFSLIPMSEMSCITLDAFFSSGFMKWSMSSSSSLMWAFNSSRWSGSTRIIFRGRSDMTPFRSSMICPFVAFRLCAMTFFSYRTSYSAESICLSGCVPGCSLHSCR